MFTHAITLAAPKAPPTSFRLFRAGKNETSKGVFVFDAIAAQSVMAKFRKAGVDLPIDLEHESLGAAKRTDSLDARGWFRLEVRNGELWATGVSWTSDGARRLRERTQRYISPAFAVDKDDRVTEVINCALVAMPATYEAAPLAASRFGARNSEVIATRLTHEQADRLRACAGRWGIKPGEYLRMLASEAADDDQKALEEIAKILGLDPDDDPADVLEALRVIVERIDAGSLDPLTESADPKPVPLRKASPKIPAATARRLLAAVRALRRMPPALTAKQLAMCREVGCDPQVFAARLKVLNDHRARLKNARRARPASERIGRK